MFLNIIDKTKKDKISGTILSLFLALLIMIPTSYAYGALTCSVTTVGSCTGTVILRMSGSTNAHAELPSQSNVNYDNNVVCCTGILSIGNSCSGNYEILGRISSATNAHMQETSVNTYGSNVCLSDSVTANEISSGYQDNNCSGYDTTLLSLSGSDNATLGDGSAYTRKLCATIIPLSINFSISANTVNFGNLSAGASRYADTSTGSGTEVEAHTISASTNAPSGYVLSVDGTTLTYGGNTIDAIGGTNTAPSVGTEQFGLRASVTSGTGTVTSPYAASGFALDTGSFPDELASGAGDNSNTVYSVRYVGNIDSNTAAGAYVAHINYVVTGTF